MLILDILCLAVSFVLGVGISFLPEGACNWLAKKGTMGSFGIREIPRRNDKTDTFANTILFIALIFSCLYWVTPDMTYIYVAYTILYLMSCIFLLMQTCRISKGYDDGHHLALFISVGMMMFVAYISAMSILNGHQVITDLAVFKKHIAAGKLWHVLYYFKNHEIFSVILQGILFFVSFYVVWAQFKYMRLEDSYKANNIVFFCIKIVFVCLILVALSAGGYYFLDAAYYVTR